MTRPFAQLIRLTGTFLRILLRDRQIVFWNFGFFLLLLVVFLAFLSGGEAAVRGALTASIVTIGLMANALFSVGIGLTAARERGIFRRFLLTPLPQAGVVSAWILARVIVVLSAAVLQLVTARVLFDVSWRGGALTLLVVLTFGTVAFAGLGFLIGAWAPAVHLANRAVNLLLIPMMALSGASLPVAMMPSSWGAARWILPATPFVDGLTGALIQGEGMTDNLGRILTLAAWAAAAFALGAYQWRRKA